MTKIGNILAKGATVAAHVIVGSVGFGLFALANHWTPPTNNPLLLAAWYGGGAAVVGGASAALLRWAKFDPSKLGK